MGAKKPDPSLATLGWRGGVLIVTRYCQETDVGGREGWNILLCSSKKPDSTQMVK